MASLNGKSTSNRGKIETIANSNGSYDLFIVYGQGIRTVLNRHCLVPGIVAEVQALLKEKWE